MFFYHLPDHAGMRVHEFVKNIVVVFGTEVTFDIRSSLNQNNSYMVKFFFGGTFILNQLFLSGLPDMKSSQPIRRYIPASFVIYHFILSAPT